METELDHLRMANNDGGIGMRVPRRHIRVRINRWLHPGGHRAPLLQNCRLFLDSFPEMDNNRNPGRRRCLIRLLRRTGRRLDSDPEGRPRRMLDRIPPTRTTTTTGFFNLRRIHTRLWCKLRDRTSSLNRLRRRRRTYIPCRRRSIELMRSRARLRRGR